MAYAKGNQIGSKPRYKTPEEMQEKIDAYFEECKGTLLTDSDGNPIIDRWGEPVYVNRKPPTITGLALALGFKTRRALLLYQAKKDFQDVVLEAKSRVELYNEEMLYSRDGAKGAMFNLSRNFAGWQAEKDEEAKGPAVAIINDIPKGSVTVNTETAVFNPLRQPEDADAPEGPAQGGATTT